VGKTPLLFLAKTVKSGGGILSARRDAVDAAASARKVAVGRGNP